MVGDAAEDFTLKDQDGNNFNLYKNLDKKILLVFYPKNNTPVCNKQLIDYDSNIEEFEKIGIKIVGINTGDIAEHKLYCRQKGFKFQLLSDIEKVVSRRFLALNLLGQNKRKIVLIGKDGEVLYEKTSFSFLYLNSAKIIKMLKENEIE